MYQRKSNHTWMKHLDFVILDIVCLEVSVLFAYFIRYGGRFVIKMYEASKSKKLVQLVCKNHGERRRCYE
ncbi:hypothetical protein M2150_000900 [Lachnospiraceae bacterium PM6-15]